MDGLGQGRMDLQRCFLTPGQREEMENQESRTPGGWVARDRQLREPRPAAAEHVGAIEVSRAELQENVHRSIQCIYGLKCRDLPMSLPLDAAVSTTTIQTYSYTI